jgi:hypothetical protein
MSFLDRIKVNPLPGFKLLLLTGLAALAAVAIESASAHDTSCDGNPVPIRIKSDCCGAA